MRFGLRRSPRRLGCSVLCLAAVALWVRSHAACDSVGYECDTGWRSIRLLQGHVEFGALLADWSNRGGSPWPRFRFDSDVPRRPFNELIFLNPDASDRDVSWTRGGFARYEKWKASGVVHLRWVAPIWALAVAAGAGAIIPSRGTARRKPRRRSDFDREVAADGREALPTLRNDPPEKSTGAADSFEMSQLRNRLTIEAATPRDRF